MNHQNRKTKIHHLNIRPVIRDSDREYLIYPLLWVIFAGFDLIKNKYLTFIKTTRCFHTAQSVLNVQCQSLVNSVNLIVSGLLKRENLAGTINICGKNKDGD